MAASQSTCRSVHLWKCHLCGLHSPWGLRGSYERYSHRQSALGKYCLSYLELCFSLSLAYYFHFKEINLKNFKQISARVPCKCGKIHPADNSQSFHATEYAEVRISLKNTGENTEIFYLTINMEKFMCVIENLNNQFTCLQFVAIEGRYNQPSTNVLINSYLLYLILFYFLLAFKSK